MISEDNLTDSQEFGFLDPADFHHLQNDPNVSNVLQQLISQDHKPLKTEIPPSFEESLHYPNANFNQIPSKEEYEGELSFSFELANYPQGKHWVHSDVLQKVFIDIEQTLPLRFKWKPPSIENLWLRTTMVFSHDQYRNEPVVRCHNHMAPENLYNINIDNSQLKHVVRCMSANSIYVEKDGHLSVITPLGVPQAGCNYVPLNFQFFCKNSCNSGMNRRPTELLFTLEDQNGYVLGRRRLLVRVCSCPKRDKEKEESEINGKVTMKGTKKRKIVETKKSAAILDMESCKLTINVPGKEIRHQILKYSFDLLAGESMRSEHSLDVFKPYMDEILRELQKT